MKKCPLASSLPCPPSKRGLFRPAIAAAAAEAALFKARREAIGTVTPKDDGPFEVRIF